MIEMQRIWVIVACVFVVFGAAMPTSAQCIEGLSDEVLTNNDDTTFCEVTPSALCSCGPAVGLPAVSYAGMSALTLGTITLGALMFWRRRKSLGLVIPTIALSALIASYASFQSPNAVWAHVFRKTPTSGPIQHLHRLVVMPAVGDKPERAAECELTADRKDCIDGNMARESPGATRVAATVADPTLGRPTLAFNCHGLTFDPDPANPTGRGQSWIANARVAQALTDNGRMEVAGAKMVGDIIVYYKDAARTMIIHTGKVTKVDGAGAVTEVRSKWGLAGTYLHPPTGAGNRPASYGDIVRYYR